MSDNLLSKMLKENDWILADGGTGTELFKMGLTSGDAPELWNIEYPDKVKQLYKSFLDEGSDLILTNSFGSNSARLKLHGQEKNSYMLSKKSAEIGKEIISNYNRPIVLAGSIGPTGEMIEPIGSMTYNEAINIFKEQSEGLKDGGADILWIETMSHFDEFKAAVDAAKSLNMEWCGTMSFDTSGRTMMGITPLEFKNLILKLDHKPIAFGANCGVGSSDLLRTIKSFINKDIKIIAKGNAGIPKFKGGKIVYDGTPEIMAKYACYARDLGASIIGGCCGTTPLHIREMKKSLSENLTLREISLDMIEDCFGKFSSKSDSSRVKDTSKNKRRRRVH